VLQRQVYFFHINTQKNDSNPDAFLVHHPGAFSRASNRPLTFGLAKSKCLH
jgi:hypothetical protein